MKRILLIEDQAVFRQSLAFLIDRQPSFRVISQAGSLTEGLSKVSEDFDVAVVDLSMPDGDGVDLISRLRAANPRVGVLALSSRRGRELYARVLRAGANQVVGKNAAAKEIFDALKLLSGGENSFVAWNG